MDARRLLGRDGPFRALVLHLEGASSASSEGGPYRASKQVSDSRDLGGTEKVRQKQDRGRVEGQGRKEGRKG